MCHLILILSIPCNFVISNHFYSYHSLDFKKISKKKSFNKKKFQIDFKSGTKYSPKFPEPQT